MGACLRRYLAVMIMLALSILPAYVYSAVFAFPHLNGQGQTVTSGLPVTGEGTLSEHTVTLTFTVPPGFHVYYNSIQTMSDNVSWTMSRPTPPRHDPNLDEDVYSSRFIVQLHTNNTAPITLPFVFGLRLQGCQDNGVCFPVQQYRFRFDTQQLTHVAAEVTPYFGEDNSIPTNTVSKPLTDAANTPPTRTPPATAQTAVSTTHPEIQSSTEDHFFGHHNLIITWLLFLGAGLLLTFTPCVFPMIPIIIGVLQRSERNDAKHGALLALFYVLGMAVTYAIIGAIAGFSGVLLSVWLQKPLFVGIFAVLIVFFALAMFDVFEIQLPVSLQNRLHAIGGQRSGPVGSFIMGLIASLMVGPCVAPPLASALIYISTTGNMLFGASALFFLGIGMGIPLIIIALLAQNRLPKSGQWMMLAKAILGCALLYVAWFLIQGFLSTHIASLLFGAITLFSSRVLWLPQTDSTATRPQRYAIALCQAASIATLLLGLISLVPPIMDELYPSGQKPWLMNTTQHTDAPHTTPMTVITIHNQAELDKAIQAGPSILDVKASWCVACRELEDKTFPPLKTRLAHYQWLVLDISHPQEGEKALMQRYQIYGPPTLLFFKAGQEKRTLRQTGFLNAADLATRLDQFDQ